MIPASDATSPKASGHFADFNAPEKIMFVSQPKGMYSACFGGLMAARAKVLGAAGVVVDGRFRDVREIQDLGLPVSILCSSISNVLILRRSGWVKEPPLDNYIIQLFARQTSILGSGPFTRASAINEPVQFNDNLWVHADDIIVGDKDGVVCVPPTMVEMVVELCKKRKEQDERVLEAVMRGATMEESMRKFR